MGRNMLGEMRLIEKTDELGDLIKKSRILSAAVKKNPSLLFSLANAAQAVAGETKLTKEMLINIINSDTQLKLATKDTAFRAEFVKFLEAVINQKLTTKPSKIIPTDAPADEPDSDEPAIKESASELSLEALALLNDIPIAHPGDIITSEHHNSLRRAIRAIAALIGDTDSTSIHTFGPTFLPASFPKPEDEGTLAWKLLYHKAVVPTVQEMGGAGGVVNGGFVVRLPDDVLIKSMIVRGKRLDEDAQDPKSFEVALVRVEPDKNGTPSQTIINTDLKDATGTFKRGEKATSSVRVDNTKYQYYVTAVWADEDDSSGFEIRSVQIICEQ